MAKKVNKKQSKNSSLSHRGRPPKEETKKLRLKVKKLFEDGLIGAQIAKIVLKSESYVYRLIREFKEEDPEINYVHRIGETSEQNSEKLNKNVHAQRIRAFVRHQSKSYRKSPNQYFKDFVDGVDIQCEGRIIYLNLNKRKIHGENETKAVHNSVNFWNKVISKLEYRLGIIIFKRGCVAFEIVYQEWESQGSIVAIDAEKRGYIWRCYHEEDGKLRFSIDRSGNSPSHEFHHRRDGHSDALTFERHLNSILDNPQAPTFGELVTIVKEIALLNRETAQGLNALVNIIKIQNSPYTHKPEDDDKPNYFG